MKVEKKTFSHIRKKVPFTGKVASMSLDTYYKEHVQQHDTETGSKKPSPWRRNFNQTHYFGPGYLPGKSPAFQEQAQRLNNFQRNIREVKGMIDFKVQMNTQQKMLDQLKLDIGPERQAVAINEVARETEPPEQREREREHEREREREREREHEREREREPLVLMIDDEVIYDEEYRFDPIWRQD